jgi:hypothetical protein
MKRLALLALSAVLLVAGCRDEGPISPSRPESGAQRDFLDGTVATGNPHFYFLPPVVKQPSVSGTANPALRPMVTLCKLSGGTCVQVAQARVGSGGAGLTAISVGSDAYQLDWDTESTPGLGPGDTVRIAIYTREPLGSSETTATIPQLGLADVVLTSNGAARKRITDDYIALVDGRTLPIKFRIEQGAVRYASAVLAGEDPASIPPCNDCVERTISTATTDVTVTTPTAHAGAFFPQGAIPTSVNGGQVTVTINRLDPASQPGGRCLPSDLPQAEGCYRFTTDPVLPDGFAIVDGEQVQVTVGVCPDPAAAADEYELYKYSDGAATIERLEPTAAGFLDCAGFTVAQGSANPLVRLASAGWAAVARPLSRVFGPGVLYARDQGLGGLTGSFSTFGYLKPVKLVKVEGDGQTAAPGGALPIAPKVRVVSVHELEEHGVTVGVAGIQVRFDASGGALGTSGTSVTLTSDADGYVVVPSWTLGTVAGSYTLEALIPPVTFLDHSIAVARVTGVSFSATAGVATVSSGTDPSGDALALPGSQLPAPDFVSTTASVSGSNLVIDVHFAPGTYRDSTETQILLDTDLNTATGYPGVDSGHSDNSLIGSDYRVDVSSAFFGASGATVLQGDQSSPTSGLFGGGVPLTGAVSVLPGQGGFTVTVPLSAIGGSTTMRMKIITFTRLGPTSSTGIQDRLTDLGAAPVDIAPPPPPLS